MGPTPAEEYERRWRWRPRKSWPIVDGETVAETVALGAEAEGGVHLGGSNGHRSPLHYVCDHDDGDAGHDDDDDDGGEDDDGDDDDHDAFT